GVPAALTGLMTGTSSIVWVTVNLVENRISGVRRGTNSAVANQSFPESVIALNRQRGREGSWPKEKSKIAFSLGIPHISRPPLSEASLSTQISVIVKVGRNLFRIATVASSSW